jgi:hypothetical protein
MTIPFTASEHIDLNVHHTIRLSKDADRELNERVTRKHLDAIIAGVNNPQNVKRGWNVTLDEKYASAYSFLKKEYNYGSSYDGVYTYHAGMNIVCTPDRERPNMEAEFQNVLNQISSRAKFPGKWKITRLDNADYEAKAVADLVEQTGNVDIGYIPLEVPADWEAYFEHLYGLDAHINRVKRAIEGTMLTQWKNRLHCALIGPPGCGKSDICHSIKNAFGDDSVLEFDATSTTMAGAQKELEEREELPRILLVEEIEKAPENSLSWLLSVMDLRGEIRKTTARKNILKDTKMITIATVNDLPTFQKIAFGALASRFSNKIFFDRPERELLGRILEREVKTLQGRKENAKIEWVIPTLDLAETLQTTDPREVINLMLCGRDSLLDGSFRREMEWTSLHHDAVAISRNGVKA